MPDAGDLYRCKPWSVSVWASPLFENKTQHILSTNDVLLFIGTDTGYYAFMTTAGMAYISSMDVEAMT